MASSYINGSLLRYRLREHPEYIKSIRSLISTIENKLTICQGNIIRVCDYRGFVIIEKLDDSSITYLGQIQEFDPPIEKLDQNMMNKKVEFIPKEESFNNEIKLKATNITFIE
jgi:hypothetical protein